MKVEWIRAKTRIVSLSQFGSKLDLEFPHLTPRNWGWPSPILVKKEKKKNGEDKLEGLYVPWDT